MQAKAYTVLSVWPSGDKIGVCAADSGAQTPRPLCSRWRPNLYPCIPEHRSRGPSVRLMQRMILFASKARSNVRLILAILCKLRFSHESSRKATDQVLPTSRRKQIPKYKCQVSARDCLHQHKRSLITVPRYQNDPLLPKVSATPLPPVTRSRPRWSECKD